ncbi:holliday junction ATP-dependent DNA helicase RuvA [Firmicutes bacterium CAG:882]|jgi:Holliday junction DNA helicase RuvA|nr:holliday junction ATP-dependent DNA helicase RuvA [Firmicutes bacterium CAG:882]
MISYIKGELVEVTENSIVLDHQGMGFSIMMPGSILDKLPQIGSELKVHTYLYVKEDILDLYGFLTRDDLKIFKLLITVNGIGPKGALAILSALSPDDLRFAVLAGDAKTISKAPGIGSKTAQKLIIELKDKLKIEDVLDGAGEGYVSQDNMADTASAEAVMALTSLGYSAADATRAVRMVENVQSMDSEAILKAALKKLAFM